MESLYKSAKGNLLPSIFFLVSIFFPHRTMSDRRPPSSRPRRRRRRRRRPGKRKGAVLHLRRDRRSGCYYANWPTTSRPTIPFTRRHALHLFESYCRKIDATTGQTTLVDLLPLKDHRRRRRRVLPDDSEPTHVGADGIVVVPLAFDVATQVRHRHDNEFSHRGTELRLADDPPAPTTTTTDSMRTTMCRLRIVLLRRIVVDYDAVAETYHVDSCRIYVAGYYRCDDPRYRSLTRRDSQATYILSDLLERGQPAVLASMLSTGRASEVDYRSSSVRPLVERFWAHHRCAQALSDGAVSVDSTTTLARPDDDQVSMRAVERKIESSLYLANAHRRRWKVDPRQALDPWAAGHLLPYANATTTTSEWSASRTWYTHQLARSIVEFVVCSSDHANLRRYIEGHTDQMVRSWTGMSDVEGWGVRAQIRCLQSPDGDGDSPSSSSIGPDRGTLEWILRDDPIELTYLLGQRVARQLSERLAVFREMTRDTGSIHLIDAERGTFLVDAAILHYCNRSDLSERVDEAWRLTPAPSPPSTDKRSPPTSPSSPPASRRRRRRH